MLTSKAIGRVLSTVIVIVTILVALLGYSVGTSQREGVSASLITVTTTSGTISTITQSGKTSTTTTTTTASGSLFGELTTFTTVTRTTLGFGGSTYATTTGEYSGCIPPVQCYLTTVTTTETAQLFELVFNETGYCSPAVYPAPWAVTLNNKTTLVEPPNASLPLPENGVTSYSPSNKNYSMIVFSVPNGTYNYTIYPKVIFRQSGTVTVNNSDVLIQVIGTGVPCTAHT